MKGVATPPLLSSVSTILEPGDRFPLQLSADARSSGRVPIPEGERVMKYQDITDRLATLPGVHSGAQAFILPVSGSSWNNNILIDGVKPKDFPNFKVVATTLRNAKTATVNDWGAVCYANGEFYQATMRDNLEIFDRVGGGDSFASGLIYGFLTRKGPQYAVDCGAAHGALAMTTPAIASSSHSGVS